MIQVWPWVGAEIVAGHPVSARRHYYSSQRIQTLSKYRLG